MYTGEHIITAGKSIFKTEVSSACLSFLYSTWLTIRTEGKYCSK